MKKSFLTAALFLFGGTPGVLACDGGAWTLEDGSRLGFVAKQAGAEVNGLFEIFDAAICFDPERLEASRVSVEIDMNSVNSQSSDRDKTIRSPDLFHVDRWPMARFEVERFDAIGDGRYEAQATLTMRDASLEVVLPFDLKIADHPDEAGQQQARAKGELTILRLDYGIGQGQWRDTKTVANEVTVTIDILAKRPML